MDQISPPMRIVLAVAVVFIAAYMLVLRPKDEPAATPATPATPATASASDANQAKTGLGKAVESARGAAAATEAKQDQEAAATGETTTNAPSTSAATAPKTKPSTESKSAPATKPADPALAKLPPWLQRSLDKKVVALLFVNDRAADDRRTRAALEHAFTAHGQVVTRAVPVAKIAKYRPVAQGVDVDQSPTLMVIDRHRKAQSLVGYSDVDAINQAIVDGLLATDDPVKHVTYLQTVRRECNQIARQAIIGDTPGDTLKGTRKNVDALIATYGSSLGTLKNAPAPAKYRPLKGVVNRYVASKLAASRAIRSTAFGKHAVDPIKVDEINHRNDKLESRTALELAAVGINSCT